MIIARRSSAARYTADPVAESVRTFVSIRTLPERPAQAVGAAAAELDLARLYPSLFVAANRPLSPIGSLRAALSRLAAIEAGIVASALRLRF